MPCQVSDAIPSVFPDDSQPELRLELNGFCAAGTTPLVITELLVWLFACHFAYKYNISSPKIRDITEREGEWTVRRNSGGDIVTQISPIGRFDPNSVEQRPAIVIRPDDWDLDSAALLLGNRVSSDELTGIQQLAVPMVGSHTIFVVANEYAECQNLTFEVFRSLLYNANRFQQFANLQPFRVAKLGAVGVLEESTENYVAPITTVYGVAHHWTEQEEAPLLKTVTASYLPH